MLGLASEINTGMSVQRVRAARGVGPTWSHVRATGGTAKTRADWALVSGVSLVSPYLKLTEDYRTGKQVRHRQPLVAALPPALRQVGQVQQPCGFKVRLQGRDTGETGETTDSVG
jgi:hypothetical protein